MSDLKDDLKDVFASESGKRLVVMLLRLLAERTDNTLDDMLVEGIAQALNV